MERIEYNYIKYIPSKGMALKWTYQGIVKYTEKDLTLESTIDNEVEECSIEEMNAHPDMIIPSTFKLPFRERCRTFLFTILLAVSPKLAMKSIDKIEAKMNNFSKKE